MQTARLRQEAMRRIARGISLLLSRSYPIAISSRSTNTAGSEFSGIKSSLDIREAGVIALVEVNLIIAGRLR